MNCIIETPKEEAHYQLKDMEIGRPFSLLKGGMAEVQCVAYYHGLERPEGEIPVFSFQTSCIKYFNENLAAYPMEQTQTAKFQFSIR